MKAYVDELPKSCWECIFADNQKGYCDLQEARILRQFTKRDISCPLQSLTDYTKQVRKEVCEEIKDLAGNYFEKLWCDYCGEIYEDIVLTGNDLTEILDQIQGE